jgi:sulfite exporter TauE/SafE
MLAVLITAFIMGGVGSLHCVGMCGPIALSLPVVGNTYHSKFKATLLYNLGRMFTYGVLGAIVGLIGASFAIAGFQQGLSIFLGIMILLFLCWPKKNFATRSNHYTQLAFARLRNTLTGLFRRHNYQSVFFIGLVNGLLPCGLVYIALAGALATGSLAGSSLFMAAFGLGTFPLMWSISFFGSFITLKTRATIRKAYPYLMFIMACLLITRGIGLDIPFLSPDMHMEVNHSGIGNNIECFKIK